MNQTPSSICYLDPAVEEALYTPGEAIAPIQPIDAMAEDMAKPRSDGLYRQAGCAK